MTHRLTAGGVNNQIKIHVKWVAPTRYFKDKVQSAKVLTYFETVVSRRAVCSGTAELRLFLNVSMPSPVRANLAGGATHRDHCHATGVIRHISLHRCASSEPSASVGRFCVFVVLRVSTRKDRDRHDARAKSSPILASASRTRHSRSHLSLFSAIAKHLSRRDPLKTPERLAARNHKPRKKPERRKKSERHCSNQNGSQTRGRLVNRGSLSRTRSAALLRDKVIYDHDGS